MKISIVFFLMCFTILAKAQTTEQKAVGTAVEKMRLALISGDRVALNEITAEGLNYGHSNGKVQKRAEFVEAVASGASDFVTIELKEQTIQVNGKTALVRHQLHATTNDGGKPGEVHLGIFLVFQKERNHWLLLGRQAFKLP